MLVAVVSDTHLPRRGRLPERCSVLVRRADVVLHAGDIATAAALSELRALGTPLEAVLGNVDEPALAAALPVRRVVEVDGVRVGMVHDAGGREGRHERLAAAFPGCAAVVYGHSHQPEVVEHRGVWMLNPGSPTERRRAPERTMLELRVGSGRIAPALVSLGP